LGEGHFCSFLDRDFVVKELEISKLGRGATDDATAKKISPTKTPET